MCGIAGSFLYKPHDLSLKNACDQMIAKLKHRGPDLQQTLDLNHIQLSHARLSIIDISNHGNQPMFSANGQYCITFNGEIYNYVELRGELKQKGYSFSTHSDTEVLLAAWQIWGKDCLAKITGMFAFGIWDKQENELFLVRDRMGEKPLFYTMPAHGNFKYDGVIFASELNALTSHPLVAKDIAPQAINQFLSLNYILTDQCIYKNVYKLKPAHYIRFKPNHVPTIKEYWRLTDCFKKQKNEENIRTNADILNEHLDRAVCWQMRSDVNYGAFLSGGLDSSSIVASMAKQIKPENINTFTIDFNEKSYSELVYATEVAKYLGVNLNSKTVTANQIDSILAALNVYGEPFADTSAIPCYYLAQFAREHVTVSLSGDAGDELFAGYETYVADKLRRFCKTLPNPAIKFLHHLINNHFPTQFNKISFDYKLKQFLQGAMLDYQRAHYSWRQIFTEAEKQKICHTDLLSEFTNDPYLDYAKYYQDVSTCHPLDQFQYIDMKTWMVDDILVKVDQSSMAHSLEVRAPFLDHNLVSFAANLPTQQRIKLFNKKRILKLSQHARLPKNIIYRKKSGFNAPVSHWLLDTLNPLLRDVFSSSAFCEYFNHNQCMSLLHEHTQKQKDNGLKLFSLLSLGLWLNKDVSHA